MPSVTNVVINKEELAKGEFQSTIAAFDKVVLELEQDLESGACKQLVRSKSCNALFVESESYHNFDNVSEDSFKHYHPKYNTDDDDEDEDDEEDAEVGTSQANISSAAGSFAPAGASHASASSSSAMGAAGASLPKSFDVSSMENVAPTSSDSHKLGVDVFATATGGPGGARLADIAFFTPCPFPFLASCISMRSRSALLACSMFLETSLP